MTRTVRFEFVTELPESANTGELVNEFYDAARRRGGLTRTAEVSTIAIEGPARDCNPDY